METILLETESLSTTLGMYSNNKILPQKKLYLMLLLRDKTTHSCKRYRHRRDSSTRQKPNTTSKPDSVGNFKSSLLETIPVFIPTLFHSARIHLQKGLPRGKYPFSLPRKKGQECQHLVHHHPLKSLHPEPHCPGVLPEGAGDKGKQQVDCIYYFYICPMRNLHSFHPIYVLSFVVDWRNKLQKGKKKTEKFGGSMPTT